jgi:hypothetical protein
MVFSIVFCCFFSLNRNNQKSRPIRSFYKHMVWCVHLWPYPTYRLRNLSLPYFDRWLYLHSSSNFLLDNMSPPSSRLTFLVNILPFYHLVNLECSIYKSLHILHACGTHVFYKYQLVTFNTVPMSQPDCPEFSFFISFITFFFINIH